MEISPRLLGADPLAAAMSEARPRATVRGLMPNHMGVRHASAETVAAGRIRHQSPEVASAVWH
jgi:hypothetical protein